MTPRDTIVEEVRSAREAYAAQFGFDIHAICRDLRERQGEGGRPVVRPRPDSGSPRPTETADRV